ncbi:MAG: hypothetical protein P3B98_01365 [Gemmatimonadota bacterium]|nr:hypothetical protein [Gemmatimonadota bacterium]
MTLPFAVGGVGSAPASAALELLGTTAATAPQGLAAGTSATAVDPALQPFAGVLARLVSLQATTEGGAPREGASMIKAALESLEAAITEGAPSLDTMAANDTGNTAIKALIEQVTRQGSAALHAPASALEAAGGASQTAGTMVDATMQALGAAAMVAPPTTPATVAAPSQGKSASVDKARDDEQATAQTTGEADGHAVPAQANPLATAAIDPSAIVRETAALDPAFRAKLDRVIERMQNEFGHKVTVVETVRSQERQDALFELGRSAPGQVVTWTRNSRHSDGLAADVMIDGGYDNPAAFERLQRIANEEGLHTLGARDAGHLELRTPQAGGFTAKVSSVIAQQPSLRPASTTPTQGASQGAARAGEAAMERITRVARVAEVAVAAGVARVATVARIAMPGVSQGARQVAAAVGHAASTASRNAATPSAPATSAPNTSTPSVNTLASNTAKAASAAVPGVSTTGHSTPAATVAVNSAPATEPRSVTTGTPANEAVPAPMAGSTIAASPTERVSAQSRVTQPIATGQAAAESRNAQRSTDAPAPAQPSRANATNAQMPAVAVSAADASARSGSRERSTEQGSRDARRPSDVGPASTETGALPFAGAARPMMNNAAPVNAVSGPDQLARVAQIDALQEQAAAQPVSSMVLTLDDGNGGTDRVRVDVRGAGVASTIDVRDAQNASQLTARASELARALEARGLESDGVTVRTVASTLGTEVPRAGAAADALTARGVAAALAPDASTPFRRDRDDARDPRAGQTPQEQDSHRQRSRREREDTQP